MIRVTRQYKFSASHRLHTPELSSERNRELFGKCNNPYGHGHDYVLQVSVCGTVDEETGLAMNVAGLDRLIEEAVLRDMRMTDLNRIPDFSSRVATTENLAEAILARLSRNWASTFPGNSPRLEKVRILETRRNSFEASLPAE
jgi:6-pyruvoyltetrahydropterin/6-carboxytetrahydropterin synthase